MRPVVMVGGVETALGVRENAEGVERPEFFPDLRLASQYPSNYRVPWRRRNTRRADCEPAFLPFFRTSTGTLELLLTSFHCEAGDARDFAQRIADVRVSFPDLVELFSNPRFQLNFFLSVQLSQGFHLLPRVALLRQIVLEPHHHVRTCQNLLAYRMHGCSLMKREHHTLGKYRAPLCTFSRLRRRQTLDNMLPALRGLRAYLEDCPMPDHLADPFLPRMLLHPLKTCSPTNPDPLSFPPTNCGRNLQSNTARRLCQSQGQKWRRDARLG